MSERNWTRTTDGLPERNQRVQWITPSGEEVSGTFAGELIWFPEGSSMYVYYQPTHWRPTASQE